MLAGPFCGFWDVNSGLHDCTARAFPAELSPRLPAILSPANPLHNCCCTQLPFPVLLHLGVTTLLVVELGRQEANRQNAKTGRRAKKRMKTLLSVLNVIVEVQIDTRNHRRHQTACLKRKGTHFSEQGLSVALAGLEPANLCLLRFCYLRAKQASTFLCSSAPFCFISSSICCSLKRFLFKGRARALSLWVSLNHMPGGFVLCV